MGDTEELPFYLRGNFAPVHEEVEAFDLDVDGALPPELLGTYLRNGPNPRGKDPGHWFTGDGMLHGVRLEGGQARWYRNRWLRTRSFEEGLNFVDENGNVDPTIAVANTHVMAHAGRTFALVESSFPTEVDAELGTIGSCDFEGKLTTGMTAHPKKCPRTGELHFFGYRFLPPWLTYHRLDASGALVRSEEIPVAGPTMIHDFAITDRHLIFMDLPIVFDLERAMTGGGFPYVWSDDYGARLGVMPREGSAADLRWFEISPCYVFHPFNAFDEGNLISIDVARYERLWQGDPNAFERAYAHRWTIDLDAGSVTETPQDDLAIEFPRIDDRRTGLPHRYGYALSGETILTEDSRQLVKFDLRKGERQVHDFGPGFAPSEGTFVPASDAAGEDEGWVVGYVYDKARNASDLYVLDASDVSKPAVATVHLPTRVPFGFHGNWIAD